VKFARRHVPGQVSWNYGWFNQLNPLGQIEFEQSELEAQTQGLTIQRVKRQLWWDMKAQNEEIQNWL
jgi:hypothetical protein